MPFLNWIYANLATILICTALVAVVLLTVIKMIKNKKGGKSSCACSCGSCSMSGICSSKQNNK